MDKKEVIDYTIDPQEILKTAEEKFELKNFIDNFEEEDVNDNSEEQLVEPFIFDQGCLRKLKTSYANPEEPRIIMQETYNPVKTTLYANSVKNNFLKYFTEYFIGDIYAEFNCPQEAAEQLKLFDKAYNFQFKPLSVSRAFYDYNHKYLLIEIIPFQKWLSFYWSEHVYETLKDKNILSKQKEELAKISDFNYTSDSKLVFTTQYQERLGLIRDTPEEAILAVRNLVEEKLPELYVHLEKDQKGLLTRH